jgi:hypothetical protein
MDGIPDATYFLKNPHPSGSNTVLLHKFSSSDDGILLSCMHFYLVTHQKIELYAYNQLKQKD